MTDDLQRRKAQTAAAFNLLADVYDAAGVGCFSYFGQQLVEVAQLHAGQTVLDVATGRGAVLFPAAERVGPDGQVVGIDLSEAMVAATRSDAMVRGIRADLRVMDGEALDFADATFDASLCGFGLMFFPNMNVALGEIHRVLKPGGRFAASTWRESQTHDLSAVLNESGFAAPAPPGWITEPADLARLLTGADFADVDVQIHRTTFRYEDLEQYWQNALGTGERRRLAALDASQAQTVRGELARRLHQQQRPDGLYVEASALFGVARR